MRHRQPRGGRRIADMVGMVFIAARVGDTKREGSGHVPSSARISPPGLSRFAAASVMPRQIAKIDQTVAAGDQVEPLAGFVQPLGDFGNLQRIVNFAFFASSIMSGERSTPIIAEAIGLRTTPRKSRSAAEIEHRQRPIGRPNAALIASDRRSGPLYSRSSRMPAFITPGEILVDILNRPIGSAYGRRLVLQRDQTDARFPHRPDWR